MTLTARGPKRSLNQPEKFLNLAKSKSRELLVSFLSFTAPLVSEQLAINWCELETDVAFRSLIKIIPLITRGAHKL